MKKLKFDIYKSLSSSYWDELEHALNNDGWAIIETGSWNQQGIIICAWEICRGLGKPLEHNLGQGDHLWLVEKRSPDSNIDKTFSETDLNAEPHTDASFRDQAPSIVIFAMQRPASCGGGKSFLVDMLDVERILKKKIGEELCNELFSTHFPFAVPPVFGEPAAPPIIRKRIKDRSGYRVRLSSIDDGITKDNMTYSPAIIEALNDLGALLNKNQLRTSFNLNAGDILVTNNKRILHGRTAFQDSERRAWRGWVV